MNTQQPRIRVDSIRLKHILSSIQDAINDPAVTSFAKKREPVTCSICLDTIEEEDVSFSLSCDVRHVYHKKCASDIVSKGNGKCGICRAPISYEDICKMRPHQHSFTFIEDMVYKIKNPDVRRAVVSFIKKMATGLQGAESFSHQFRMDIKKALDDMLAGPDIDLELLMQLLSTDLSNSAPSYEEDPVMPELVDEIEQDIQYQDDVQRDPDYNPLIPEVQWYERRRRSTRRPPVQQQNTVQAPPLPLQPLNLLNIPVSMPILPEAQPLQPLNLPQIPYYPNQSIENALLQHNIYPLSFMLQQHQQLVQLHQLQQHIMNPNQ
jgi:RING-like zinc finger